MDKAIPIISVISKSILGSKSFKYMKYFNWLSKLKGNRINKSNFTSLLQIHQLPLILSQFTTPFGNGIQNRDQGLSKIR